MAETTMLLTADELVTVRLALRRCANELEAQMEGEGPYIRVTASAWFACAHIRAKIGPLLDRIEKTLNQAMMELC